MIGDIKAIYRDAWMFALACPLLFLVPVAVEMAQHVVELNAGMYTNEAGAAAAEADPLRLWFGFAKTVALLLPGYWFTRYIMFGHDAARARAIEWPAIGLWLVLLALGAAQSAFALFGTPLADLAGFDGSAATSFTIVETIAVQIVAIYLTVWLVAWPLGNAALGPVRSARIMHGSFWYAFGLFVAGFLPLMIVHYGLAIVAVVWAPGRADWLLMAIDAVVVGFLALTIAGSAVYAARRAAARRGTALLPEQTA